MNAEHVALRPAQGHPLGEIAALVSAASWAGTSTALARLGTRYDAPVLSALRLLFATPLLVAVFLLGSRAEFDLTSMPVLAMVASGLIGYGIGDTAYIRTMSKVGIQKLAPTATAAWVSMSAIGGIVLLDEPAAWTLLVGGAAVVAGCFLVVRRASGGALAEVLPGEWGPVRVAVAILVVASAWTAATLLLAGGRGELSSAAAALLRIPSGGLTIAAVILANQQRRHATTRLPRGRDLLLMVGVGIVGTGLGSWLYIYAVGEAGAARAVILNSTSPLMALPLAVIFLRERLTRNILAGTALCMAGTLIVLAS